MGFPLTNGAPRTIVSISVRAPGPAAADTAAPARVSRSLPTNTSCHKMPAVSGVCGPWATRVGEPANRLGGWDRQVNRERRRDRLTGHQRHFAKIALISWNVFVSASTSSNRCDCLLRDPRDVRGGFAESRMLC
jgi:hypothetical protein